jgi:mutator protein MutT
MAMKQVAKLVIIDNDNKYLMMYRSAHPVFGDDPDLPGGTIEQGESPIMALIREVREEAGVEVAETGIAQVYEGTDYSDHDTDFFLYVITLDSRPTVTISWEHKSYEWLERDIFLDKARSAKDNYMHMVQDVLHDK